MTRRLMSVLLPAALTLAGKPNHQPHIDARHGSFSNGDSERSHRLRPIDAALAPRSLASNHISGSAHDRA